MAIVLMEPLEDRRMLSSAPVPVPPDVPGSVPLTPAQVTTAYGVNDIVFGAVKGNGAGQTIAIIGGGADPDFIDTGAPGFATSDLAMFDYNEGLPNPPSFEVVGEAGGAPEEYPDIVSITEVGFTATVTTASPQAFLPNDVVTLSGTGPYDGQVLIDTIISPTQFTFTAPPGLGDSVGGTIVNPVDSGETAMDIEWSHAMAPAANIVLIEMSSFYSVSTAIDAAATVKASVVSMSFGVPEYPQETGSSTSNEDDGLFTNSGISYIASSGDTGYPGDYPADSPNVLAVGATNLTLNPNNSYLSETGWSNPPAITNATESGTTVTIATATPTGLAVGNQVVINGVGVAGYDDAYFTVASVPSDTSFTFTAPAGLLPSSPATIKADGAREVGNTVRITTASPQDFVVGDIVDISGVGVAGYNDNVAITAVLSPTTFTYTDNTAGLAPSGGGTVSGIVFGDGSAGPTGTNVGGTGGGPTQFELQPAYQQGVVPASMSTVNGSAMRTTPDVSFVGGTDTPVIIYDSYGDPTFPSYPYFPSGGTSLSAPCWAGLVAIMDQGRALLGEPPLNTSNQTSGLQALLYKLPASDYHDVTVGYNGYYAGPGYDLVTGLGTPIANQLVPDLVDYGLPTVSPAQTTAKANIGGSLLKYAVTPTISDPDQPASTIVDLRMSVNVGTLTVPLAASGVRIVAGSDGSGSVTVQGTVQQLDIVVMDLSYTSSGTTPATLSFTPIAPTGGVNGGPVVGTPTIVTITISVPPVAQNLFTHTGENASLTLDLANLVTSPTDPLNFSTFQITDQLGNGTIDTSVLGTTGVVTYTPPTGFIGGDTFYYTVSSTAGLVSNTGIVWIVVGPTGSLSGYSYVDQNNNGIKEPNDVGIAGVSVTVQKTDGTFTFSQTVQTQANGSYVLNNLPAGVYTITENQPAFFEQGKETAGTPAPAASASGQFSGITLTGTATSTESGSGYDFGQLGLRAQFALTVLTSRVFFASSETTLTGFSAATGDTWVAFNAGIVGTLNAAASTGGSGTVSLTLYNNNLQPLVTLPATTTSDQLTYQGISNQPYFLELVSTSASPNLQTSINTPAVVPPPLPSNPNNSSSSQVLHNSANPLDVYGDGTVTPSDALAVINLLNTIGPGPLAGKQVPAGIMPDVLGNGTLSPDDALQIIDYLNNLTPPPQPQDVAPAVSAAGPPVVTPAVASPLPATTNPSLPLAASEAATIILPAAVAAQTVPAESVAPLNTAATLQSSATQPAITSPLLAARTQFFASNGPPAAPSKSVLSGSQQMDPAAVAMAMSQHKGPWDTL